MTVGPIARLQPEDSTYWFVREAFGWSVVLQILWRFPRPLERQALEVFSARLTDGVLHRRLIRARTPFARARWVHADFGAELLLDTESIAADAVEDWAGDELNRTPLDPETGPVWRLRGSPVDDGGYALSPTTLHLVADGKSMVSAAVDALTGTATDPLAARPLLRGAAAIAADAFDGLRQIGAAGQGLVRAGAAAARRPAATPGVVPDAAKSAAHARAPHAYPQWATVTVDADNWQRIAAKHGGTTNTLFIAVLTGALRASGYAELGRPVKIGIPVSQRTDDDERGNATAGVSVLLTDEPVAGGNLGPIRSKCKAAFTSLAAGNRAPHIHLLPLIQLLPTSLIVRAATAGSGMPDVVASNLGRFTPELLHIGGESASAVAFRGIAQGVDPALPYRFGDGVQSWLIHTGSTMTFSVVAFDEMHFPDPGDLRTLLTAELDQWEVSHRMW